MSGQPAARVGDMHTCPMVSPGPVPHVGGPILQGELSVLIGGSPAARMGDNAVCAVPPDVIAKGAFPVPIGGKPAARKKDTTVHGGVIVTGCPSVLIGLAGTAGNVRVGTDMCHAAAGGRGSGKTRQSYENCGVESSRQIINQATNSNITENQLLQTAINNRWAAPAKPAVPATPTTPAVPAVGPGGTKPVGRQAILAHFGVASTVQASNVNNLGQALSGGKGVIANVDAGVLWGNRRYLGGGHAITVTGIEYDDNGNATKVIINDTGTGQCGREVPINTWNSAVNRHRSPRLNVTDNPIF